ncbi:F-box only protein 16-like isoform X2 [Dysidea avara]|uniref:F-box only protein 16-like isoform X2 n=1 Tax=Dysidea avara TaxID=196820 RepID=UPI00332BE76D
MELAGLDLSLRRNSTWTPKNHKPSRETYNGWTAEQRRYFIEHVLMKCTMQQLALIDTLVHPQMPTFAVEFTRVIPRHLCLKIFSLLDPRSLCRSSQVCWYWHYLTEENCIWKPKCLRFGWTLPQPPVSTDLGIWKRHYLSCVRNLHWVPPSTVVKEQDQQDISILEDTQTQQPVKLDTTRKRLSIRRQSRRKGGSISFSQMDTTSQQKPVWRHPDRHPKNISQSTILNSSWMTHKHPRSSQSILLKTYPNEETSPPSGSLQEDNEQFSLHDQVSIDDEVFDNSIHNPRPRKSLPLTPNRKPMGRVYRSDTYSSLLKNTQILETTSKEITTPTQTPLSTDTENTELTTKPWLIAQHSDNSDSDV